MEQINVAICYSESVKSVVWTLYDSCHAHPLYEYLHHVTCMQLSAMGWMECKKVLHKCIILSVCVKVKYSTHLL